MDEKKKHIINKVTGILLDEMSRKNVSPELGQEIAAYILDQSKNIKEDKDINNFLKSLADKYSIFKPYYVNKTLEKHIEQTDAEKINSIKDQLSELANFKTK